MSEGEPTGRDRFPGGADPVLSEHTRRRLARYARPLPYLGTGLLLTLIFTALDAFWDEPFSWSEFLVRVVVYSVVAAAFPALESWWKRRKARRD